MPIPPPAAYRPSNLTNQQRQDQLAACYGVPMPSSEFSAEQIETMRQILAKHDSEHKAVTIHDLNNPPKQPFNPAANRFPLMVYDLQNSKPAHDELRTRRAGNTVVEEEVHIPARIIYKIVTDEKELRAAVADGLSEQAPDFRDEEASLADGATKYAGEAERVQLTLAEANKRSHQKRNAQRA